MKGYLIPDLRQIQDYIEIADKFQMAFEYNEFYHPEILDNQEKQREIIREYRQLERERNEDTLHGAFMDVTVVSADKRIREVSMLRVRQSMEIARELGVRAVVFHTNYIANFKLKSYCDSWLKGNAEFFQSVLEEYHELEIFMENMFDDSPYLLQQLANLVISERFGVCFDVAHAAISKTPIPIWFQTLAPYIKHMHINDNDLKSDLHKAIGEGMIDWVSYGSLMEQYNLSPSVLLEVKGIDKINTSIAFLQKNNLRPFET